MNRLLTLFAATACAALAVSSACFAATGTPIAYQLKDSGKAGEVQLRLDTHLLGDRDRSWSQSIPVSEFRGLVRGRPPARFALVREAGQLDCQGDRSSDAGTCVITPNPAFAAGLAQRGIDRPDAKESFQLVMAGSSLAVADAMRSAGYGRPDLDELVALGIFKVTPATIAAYRAAGVKIDDADDLIAMAIFKVTPDYLGSLKAAGYRDFDSDSLVQLRTFGIGADEVRAARRDGIATPSADQLVEARLGFGHRSGHRR